MAIVTSFRFNSQITQTHQQEHDFTTVKERTSIILWDACNEQSTLCHKCLLGYMYEDWSKLSIILEL